MRQSLPPVTVIMLCSDKKLDDEPTYLQNNILAMHGETKQTDKYPPEQCKTNWYRCLAPRSIASRSIHTYIWLFTVDLALNARSTHTRLATLQQQFDCNRSICLLWDFSYSIIFVGSRHIR